MNKKVKLDSFIKLYHLINFYYENRDRPADKEFDFFEEVKTNCEILEIDYDLFYGDRHHKKTKHHICLSQKDKGKESSS